MRMDSLSAVVVENLLCDRSGNARRNGKRKIKAFEFGLLRVDFFLTREVGKAEPRFALIQNRPSVFLETAILDVQS